jgi:hypothetical protein
LADWINAQGFDFIYWNMMHDAYYFSIATLPEIAKLAIADRLLNAQVDDRTRQEFNHVIDFMNRGASLDGNLLREQIANLDRRRGESLDKIEPEFAQLIDYVAVN